MPSLQLALLAEILLPFSCTLSLDDIRLTTPSLDLLVENQELQAACPACGTLAYRIHSRYGRLLTDLPCCGRQLHLHGLVRRFFLR